MPIKYSTLFSGELADLVERRTSKLRHSIWPARGAAKNISQKHLRESIDRLNSFAEHQLMRSRKIVHLLRGPKPHSWRVKGRGVDHKVNEFKKWFKDEELARDFVYVIWRRKKCLYVGRTGNGPGRTTNHFKNAWFVGATRVDAYPFSGKRGVPRYECLL